MWAGIRTAPDTPKESSMPEWLILAITVIVATPLIWWFWPAGRSVDTETRPPKRHDDGWGSPSDGVGGGGGDGGGGGH
jgi:hypothetical protein